MSGFKTSKCFEGAAPVLIWAATSRLADGSWWKGFIVADAQQQSYGVRLSAERPEDLKVNGAVVAAVRKHAKTSTVAGIWADPETGHQWLPLFTGSGRSETPPFWLQLAHGLPPELRFYDATGAALVRKSSQGTFTKRRSFEAGLPNYPLPPGMLDLTPLLLSGVVPKGEPAGEEAAGTGGGEGKADGEGRPEEGDDQALVLPQYQRSARDRLSRRLKTLRKSAEKLAQQQANAAASQALSVQAAQLGAFLHRVKPEAISLTLTSAETGLEEAVVIPLDPDKTPGQNLSALHERMKKARRGAGVIAQQLRGLHADIADLSRDVLKLRSEAVSEAVVEQLYRRYHLAAEAQAAQPEEAKGGFRSWYWHPPGSDATSDRVSLLVGRSAADSDELVRQAKGHDLWVHVAGGATGSHVIIPFRQLKKGIDPALVRAAAILALHFSKLRSDLRGEVYVTRRQFIKKRKGMAPGLWQVDQAETLFFRYEPAELQRLLDQTEKS